MINKYSWIVCSSMLLLLSFHRVINIAVDPANVAIPTSLINQNDVGQLEFLFYIQVLNGFISIEDLQLAVQVCMDSFFFS